MKAAVPGEVRLRIEAALTCGAGLKVFKRGCHAKTVVPPAVFGHELAGTTSEIAPTRPGGEKVAGGRMRGFDWQNGRRQPRHQAARQSA